MTDIRRVGGSYVPYRGGDILLFQGTGIVSWGIRAVTCPCLRGLKPSTHVAVVADVGKQDLAAAIEHNPAIHAAVFDWKPRPLLLESTTLSDAPCVLQGKPVSGVQAHEVSAYVATYPGCVWRMRLRDPLTTQESRRLTSVLLGPGGIGTDYDTRGAALCASLWLKHGIRAGRAADRATLYCAELVVAALQHALGAQREFTRAKPGTMPPGAVEKWAKRELYCQPRFIGGRK